MTSDVRPDARHLFVARVAEALLVRPGEGRRTALLFTHLFLASAVFVMGRTVRDTLFLAYSPSTRSRRCSSATG